MAALTRSAAELEGAGRSEDAARLNAEARELEQRIQAIHEKSNVVLNKAQIVGTVPSEVRELVIRSAQTMPPGAVPWVFSVAPRPENDQARLVQLQWLFRLSLASRDERQRRPKRLQKRPAKWSSNSGSGKRA